MKKKINWNIWLSGPSGSKGYYIKELYGPFKTKTAAEFFNFIAFGSPKSLNASEEAKSGIKYMYSLDKSLHPSKMFSQNAPFSVWWQDMYGERLSNDMIMKLAYECKAGGYESFIDWLLLGSKIAGKVIHCQYCAIS